MSIFSLRGNGKVEFIDISEENVPMLVYLSAIYDKLTGIQVAIYREQEIKEGDKDDYVCGSLDEIIKFCEKLKEGLKSK